MAPPSPDQLDFPVPQRCFEVGGSSESPEDVKRVLPESVILRSNDVVTSAVEPAVQSREDVRAEVELSRYAQGYYNNDYMIEMIPEENEEE